jgi:hypothetical protein
MIDWLAGSSRAEVDDWLEPPRAVPPDPLALPGPLAAKPPAGAAGAAGAPAAAGAWAAPATAADEDAELLELPEQPASPQPQMMVPAIVPAMSTLARWFSR